MDIYTIDPASVARHHAAFWTALAATAVLSAVITASARRKTWWSIALVALLTPTLATIPFGAQPDFSLQYVPDVVLPLALILGIPGTLIGLAAGWAIRRWRQSSNSSQIG